MICKDNRCEMSLRTEISDHVLPLARPFATSRFTLTARRSLVLTVSDTGTGHVGRGEATPLEEFGTESYDDARAALAAACCVIEGAMRHAHDIARRLTTDSAYPALDRALANTPTARFAVECALRDLDASLRGMSMAAVLAEEEGEGSVPDRVRVNAVLAGGDLANTAEAVRAAGFSCVKMKVGALAADDDVARVRTLREMLGGDVQIRLDANGAWSEAQSREICARLAPYGIEYIEQPVAAEDVDALERLHRSGGIPIAADEAVTDLATAHALLARDVAAVYILKPMALGSLAACGRFAREAVAAGRDVVFTSLIDGAIGRRAVAHLAASLAQICTRAHGLATGSLFTRAHFADRITRGHLHL